MPTALMRPGSNMSGAATPTRLHKLRHSAVVPANTCSGWRVIAVTPRHWRMSIVCADAPNVKAASKAPEHTTAAARIRRVEPHDGRQNIESKRDHTEGTRRNPTCYGSTQDTTTLWPNWGAAGGL